LNTGRFFRRTPKSRQPGGQVSTWLSEMRGADGGLETDPQPIGAGDDR
jgi:hypothetical protein